MNDDRLFVVLCCLAIVFLFGIVSLIGASNAMDNYFPNGSGTLEFDSNNYNLDVNANIIYNSVYSGESIAKIKDWDYDVNYILVKPACVLLYEDENSFVFNCASERVGEQK